MLAVLLAAPLLAQADATAIAGTLLAGAASDPVLAALLAAGGLGLGTGFATLIGHLTNAVPAGYATDISGVSTTTLQIGGVLGVAAFGSVYLTVAGASSPDQARHGFAVTVLLLAATALLAAGSAYRATHAKA